MRSFLILLLFSLATFISYAQPGRSTSWSADGDAYYTASGKQITLHTIESGSESVFVDSTALTPNGQAALRVEGFSISDDLNKVLVFTNSKRVWRYNTRGDYWLLDRASGSLKQLGKNLPESSLMFAKLSPDGTKAAYVSEHNVYMEDLSSGQVTKLTDSQGKPKLINGTFDWAYEEEFSCLDGFRWSPDSEKIAYWQIDASDIRNFNMINTTDSIYSYNIPVEYPKVGETPSAARIGVVEIESGETTWMNVPGDDRQHYIPRMDWVDDDKIVIQQLNRKQNQSKLMYLDAATGDAETFYEETDEAWISVRSSWNNGTGWYWLEDGKSFLWITEKDGWRHVYKISADGGKETLITSGEFDMISAEMVDEENGVVYYMASPEDATESYLYQSKLNGKGTAKRITPENQEGTHSYMISPNGELAMHRFQNYFTRPMSEWVELPSHEALNEDNSIAANYSAEGAAESQVKFIEVTTEDGVTMDAFMAYPDNFDPAKKYPVLFYVYTEPAGATVKNRYGIDRNGFYQGDLAEDGYFYISMDNRGTPAPKGREWRKSIYRKIGRLNIHDQAMGAKKLLEEYPFLDPERVAVWGWSGGGSATLNLLFQHPEIYTTGVSVAAVADQLTYDNIYQERYMGLPQENMEDFVQGSPITYAKNLEGNLLYIHGTGDDNVHYQNAERLINELVKYNKQFMVMPYPNRSHGIYEGEGTREHLSTLFTNYLQTHCPPGARGANIDQSR